MRQTLRRDLLGILTLGVLFAFGLLMSIRVLSELPVLYRLETQSDQNAVRQVRQSLSGQQRFLERFALDYSAWDLTHDFIESTPGSDAWNYYVEKEINTNTLLNNRVNGFIFLDAKQSVVYSYAINLKTGEPDSEVATAIPAAVQTLTRRPAPWTHPFNTAILNSGYVETDLGPVIFASAEIRETGTSASGDSRGSLIVWRHFDENYWRELEDTLGIDLDFTNARLEASRDDLAQNIVQLESSSLSFIPRGRRNYLTWLLRDLNDEPFMLVRQNMPPRNFDDRWITGSVFAGFGAFGLVTFLIGIFLSHRVLQPIAYLRDIAMKIGDGQLQLTTKIPNEDEIGELSQSINLMSASLLEARAHLEDLAYKDALTGLSNRRIFIEFLSKALQNAKRDEQAGGLALLFIDLDGFKEVNDTAGHEAGDYVLKQVAERVVQCLRTGDIVARSNMEAALEENFEASRFGGDEFTILVSHLESPETASIVAERILAEIATPYTIEGEAYHITASIGIATYPEDGDDPLKLIQCADNAMYTAKQSGKNKTCYYDPVLSAKGNEELRLRNALSQAIEEDQLQLHYQPIYGLGTGQVIGCEALLRWIQPDSPPVSPAIFIPIAEDAGLMKEIGHWVLESACRQQRAWQEQGVNPPSININVSAHQFQDNFAAQVQASLEKYHIGPETLRIEITETSMMQDCEKVAKALEDICAMGVAISLDDFGTGYSSLAMLKSLPIDNVKIDKSFIDALAESLEGKAIVKAVIAMSKELGLSVTAEGVEVEEQFALLRDLDCNFAQGFLMSKPLTAEKMTALISAMPEENQNSADAQG